MKFELPEIKIKKFEFEDIVTTSGMSNAAKMLADEMSKTATGGINVVKWKVEY